MSIILLGVLAGAASGHLVPGVLAGVLIWVGSLYVNPFTNCGWCKGTGKNRLRTKRNFGTCKNPRCNRGTVQRLGSKTAHRAVRALAAARRNSKEK